MDIQTVILGLAVGNLVFGLVLVLFQRRAEPTQRIPFWAAAKILQFSGWLLLFGRGTLPDLLSFTVGNSCLLSGFAYECWTMYQISQRPVSRTRHLSSVAAVTLVCILATPLTAPGRIVVASFASVIFFALSGRTMLNYSGERSLLRGYIGWSMWLLVILTSVRGLWALVAPEHFTLFAANAIQLIVFLALYYMMLTNGFGILLLAKETTDLELQEVLKQQQASNAQLRESEARFRSYFELPLAGRAITSPDKGWLDVNATLCDMLGYTKAELTQMTWAELTHPDDLAADVALFNRIMAGEIDGYTLEKRFIHQDGHAVYAHLAVHCLRLLDRSVDYFMASIQDITDRKRAEEALRESQSLYRSLIEVSPLCITRKDLAGRFTFANRRFLEESQITLADLVGKTDFDLHPSELAEKYRRDDQAVVDSQQVQELIEERALIGGESIIVQSIKTPIYDGAGNINGVQISFWDITARKQAEDALARRAHELTVLHQTTLQINAQPDLTMLLRTIADRQVELTGTNGSSVYLLEPDGQSLRKVVTNRESGWADVVLPLGEGVAGRVAQTGQPFMIEDYSAWAERPVAYANSKVRRVLGVPLRIGQRVIGVITVVDDEHTDPFTDETIQLVSLFADQAAIAIENARLMEAEHTQRQLAEALRDTAAALNSTLTLNEVFDHILANVERIVPHEAANIMLINDGIAHIVRHRGFTERGADHLVEVVQFRVEDVNNLRYMQETGQALAIPDVRVYPGWVSTPDIYWVTSHVGAPLRLKGQVIGFLNLDTSVPHFYTPLHAERLQAFADQAALAVENARLFEAERARHRELEAVYEASRLVTQSLDVTSVLGAISMAALKLTPAEYVQIFFYDGERLDFGSALTRQGQIEPLVQPRQNGLTYTAARSGETIFVEDTLHHPKYNLIAHVDHPQLAVAALTLLFEDKVVGVMNVSYEQPHHFADEEQRVLKLLATQAATAIQHARLHQQVRDHAQQLEQRVADRTTELQAANLRLTELDRLKDEFLSRISHELRTPLTSIKIYIELLETARPEKREKYLQTLKREADRLHALIEEVLMFSQVNRYTRPATLEPIDLNNLIEGHVTTWQRLSAGHDLAFQLELAGNLPHARADGNLFIQALTRLIANAANYTPAGSITVSTAYVDEGDQRWATVSVKDTGPGITPDDLPHIFERFYRGRAAADYKTPGIGVGLSISREIAEKLGGHLTVDTQVGAGSTFTLWLPVAE